MEKTVNHVEVNEWLDTLSFYKGGLKFWRNRLSEIVSRNTTKEVLSQLEHFQNQMIIQEEQIDILRHDVKQFENIMERDESQNSVYEKSIPEMEVELRERMKTFEHIYVDLKHEFFNFLRNHL